VLILSRHPGQSIYIGDDIEVTICAVNGSQVKIGINAPATVKILREEVAERIKAEEQP
jgi:carbon storage regulator